MSHTKNPSWTIILYLKNYKFNIFAEVLVDFIWASMCIALPVVIGFIFDVIYSSLARGELFTEDAVYYLSLGFIIILLTYVTTVLTNQYTGRITADVSRDIRSDLFKSLQAQSHKYFDDQDTGDLVSKSSNDITAVISFFTTVLILLPILIGEFVFTIFFLFLIDWQVAVTALISLPIMYLLTKRFEKMYSPVRLDAQNQFGVMSSVLTENIDMAKISRTFPSQHKEIDRFDKHNVQYKDLAIKSHKLRSSMQTQGPTAVGIVMILLISIGGYKVMIGELTIGSLMMIIFLSGWLNPPVRHIGNIAINYSNLKASSARIVDVIESVPDIQSADDPYVVDSLEGEIFFDNVSFGFRKEAVLKDITLRIEAKQKIAVLGTSGSGKSSLINLIPRYYDTSSGTVFIDGVDVRNYDLQLLRKSIGFVDQETFLFSKPIRENIAFGKPDATIDEVIEAAKNACIHDYIESLPDGYNTIIGERGVTLSGGQKQRLSIARAILYNPGIVIFDDSLSAVDMKTEYQIKQALDELLKDRTVIFVTQRLSTISNTDLIVIMSKGSIVECGSEDELLAKGGIFAKLYETQVDDILDLSILNGEELEVDIN
ncbi:MAG: ABC transporter ATP-binding protein [Candidatus Heimdallarchaeota archaeon]|nr:ABC transporter ATP-binding protein [Candidatus Heimdallarchaeota archaeon]